MSTHSNLATTHVFSKSLSHTCGWRLVPRTIGHVFGTHTKSFASIQMRVSNGKHLGLLSFQRSALGFDLVSPLSLGFSILVGGVRDMLTPLNGSFHLDPLGDLTTCPCFLFYVLVRSPAPVPSKYQLLFGSQGHGYVFALFP
jgi:hypothetical protein